MVLYQLFSQNWTLGFGQALAKDRHHGLHEQALWGALFSQSTPSFGISLYSNTAWSYRFALFLNFNPDPGPWQDVGLRHGPQEQALKGEEVAFVEAVVLVSTSNIYNLIIVGSAIGKF